MPIRVRPQPKMIMQIKIQVNIQIPRVLGDKNKNSYVGCDWAFTITIIGVTHLCGGKPAQPSLSNSVATLQKLHQFCTKDFFLSSARLLDRCQFDGLLCAVSSQQPLVISLPTFIILILEAKHFVKLHHEVLPLYQPSKGDCDASIILTQCCFENSSNSF